MGTHLYSLKSNLQINNNMQIFVQGEAVQALQVSQQTTVAELQTMVAEAGNMIVNGEILNNVEATLADYGIQEEATIQIVHPVLGGGRKRKKKVYTTPKKIKHKRVKVKLVTLKLYKVDDTGKVERKRKECPHETCGAGIFMSNHKDRHYCGKCQLTMKFDKNGKSPFA